MTATRTYVSNAAETTLSTALTVGSTTVNVTSTTGFPAVPFYAVIEPSVDAKREVVLATAKTATTLTVTRAQDASTDVAHDSGVAIKVVPVAAHITDLHDRMDTVSNAYVPGGTDVAVADGGTGASTAANARTNLGLGSIATVNSPVPVANGGTAATDAATARTNLAALGTAGGTMSGELDLADNLLTRPVIKDYGEETAANATATGAVTVDIVNGNVHDLTLTGNVTLTISNPTASGDACSLTLILRQDATGSRAVTWPASVKWPSATAPTLTTTASAVDIITLVTVNGGTTWYGAVAGKAFG